MRTEPRPRHAVSDKRLRWLSPLLRYSASRDAYVLKGVGRSLGPVYTLRESAASGSEAAPPASQG